MRMIEDPLVSVMRLVASLKFARDVVPLHFLCEAQLRGQLGPVADGLSVSHVRLVSSR
jgi:hypothetical protein